MVVKGARSQHVLRGQRQRVDPVPVPLQRSHQLALLRHKHTDVSQSMWQSQHVAGTDFHCLKPHVYVRLTCDL